jgi:hypothetical protein
VENPQGCLKRFPLSREKNVAARLVPSEQFIVLFNNLKNAAGNSRERVRVFYKDSKAIRDALHGLHEFFARTDLERRVVQGRKGFIPRAAGFETAWKEYEAKWRFRVVWPEPEVMSDEEFLEFLEYVPVNPSIATDERPIATDERPWRGEQIELEPPTTEDEPEGPEP